jgi:PleD family two-component response regulator
MIGDVCDRQFAGAGVERREFDQMGESEMGEREKPSLQVLIVEDEAMIAMLLKDMLTDLGHRVSGSSSRMSDAEVLVRKPKPILQSLTSTSPARNFRDRLRRGRDPWQLA